LSGLPFHLVTPESIFLQSAHDGNGPHTKPNQIKSNQIKSMLRAIKRKLHALREPAKAGITTELAFEARIYSSQRN
jgi:uncharacterized protein with von Willebrand factor type A (vWA) domain